MQQRWSSDLMQLMCSTAESFARLAAGRSAA